MALGPAREGAAVVVSDIDKASGEGVVEEIRQTGGTAHFVAADVSKESDVAQMIGEGTRQLGGLDILVNNAGIEIVNPVTAITEEEWDRLMGVNVKGVFLCCKHVLNLRQGRLGTIDEVVGAVLFLASDAASFVNGHALPLDNAGLSG